MRLAHIPLCSIIRALDLLACAQHGVIKVQLRKYVDRIFFLNTDMSKGPFNVLEDLNEMQSKISTGVEGFILPQALLVAARGRY